MDLNELNEMKTIKDKVRWILSKSERARNEDKYLLLLYWKYVDGVNFSNFINDFLSKATCEKSIIRARQLVQAEGQYLPTEETAIRRRQAEKAYKHTIAGYGEVPEGIDYDCDYDY